jgi:hypothetical protein
MGGTSVVVACDIPRHDDAPMTAVLAHRPAWLSARRMRLVLFGLSLVGVIWAAGVFLMTQGGPGFDTFAYWRSTQVADPYTVLNGFGAFQYTPAARVLFAPLGLFPWPAVYWFWLALSLGLLTWISRVARTITKGRTTKFTSAAWLLTAKPKTSSLLDLTWTFS